MEYPLASQAPVPALNKRRRMFPGEQRRDCNSPGDLDFSAKRTRCGRHINAISASIEVLRGLTECDVPDGEVFATAWR